MPDPHKINESSFFDHFDNNVMEYPRSLWRKIWNWKPLYWLRCHTFTQYHKIDCRNDYYDAGDGYSWGWFDRSEILLIAPFNILVEFMEKEHPGEFIDWSSDPLSQHAWNEMSELYLWWKSGRKQEREAQAAILDALPPKDFDEMFKPIEGSDGKYCQMVELTPTERNAYDRYNDEEQRLDQKDEDQLVRLMKIRRFLWT